MTLESFTWENNGILTLLNDEKTRFVVRDHDRAASLTETRRSQKPRRSRDSREEGNAPRSKDIRHLGEYPQRLWVGILTKKETT